MAPEGAQVDSLYRRAKRRPFSSWVKRIAHFKGGNGQHKNIPNSTPMSFSVEKDKHASTGVPFSRHVNQNVIQNQMAVSEPGAANPVTTAYGVAHMCRGKNDFVSIPSARTHVTTPGRDQGKAPASINTLDTVSKDAAQARSITTTTGTTNLSDVVSSSLFSSTNHSEHSLRSTATTLQSAHNIPLTARSSIHAVESVVPSHHSITANMALTRTRHLTDSIPTTYATATANNLLSDDASILTLASSSKRRRRSLESYPDASIRAIPPSSLWSTSRESLPLSVLSGNVDVGNTHHNHAGGLTAVSVP